jgi:hypothetical protein
VDLVMVRIQRAHAVDGHGQLHSAAGWDPGREEAVGIGYQCDQQEHTAGESQYWYPCVLLFSSGGKKQKAG